MDYHIKKYNLEFDKKKLLESIISSNNIELKQEDFFQLPIPEEKVDFYNFCRNSEDIDKYSTNTHRKIMFDLSKERGLIIDGIPIHNVNDPELIVLSQKGKLLEGKVDLISTQSLAKDPIRAFIYAKSNDPSYFSDIRKLIKKL